MNVLTEANLRSAHLVPGTKDFKVPAGTFVTPLAKQYLRDRNIRLVEQVHSAIEMPRVPIVPNGEYTYIDAKTGQGYREKPEHMTHLRGNLLVPKTDLRIKLRGKLDSLEADILKTQVMAMQCGMPALAADLQDALRYTKQILAAEVKEEPLAEAALFGLSQAKLRYISHHIQEEFGISHPVPDYRMGEPAVSLNLLRTRVRETELAAAAFAKDLGAPRYDIVQALNRLSSGIYILFCRVVTGYYGKEGEAK